MHYTAVGKKPNGDWRAQCALATTDKYNLKKWKLHGTIFPEIEWSKSGGLTLYFFQYLHCDSNCTSTKTSSLFILG